MLKRHQVLLDDWMAEHIKGISEVYDISFSEAIRGALSLAYLDLIAKTYPSYKIDLKGMNKRLSLKRGNLEKIGSDQFHKDLSILYFEARKAIEFFWEQQKKQKTT